VTAIQDPYSAPQLELTQGAEGHVVVKFSGNWRLEDPLPEAEDLQESLGGIAGLKLLSLDSTAVTAWDSGFVSYLIGIINWCKAQRVEISQESLFEGVRELMKLAFAVPERKGARRVEKREQFLERLGKESLDLVRSTGEIMAFIGKFAIALRQLLARKARYRPADLWLTMQEVGADALPIVSLVSFLVGMILAYIANQQLAQFGARIYVANLVGLAMVIQMGALAPPSPHNLAPCRSTRR
jgi:phospholipid/cholesterol/gamma-HCH transport system permease protein